MQGKLLLRRADESFKHESFKHAPKPGLPPEEREEYPLVHAYLLALSGDSGAAQRELRSVLAADPQNAGAAKGLAILETV